MIKLSNSASYLLADLHARVTAQDFGGWLQDALGCALDLAPAHRGCYANRGAGQPDIQTRISGMSAGVEVKTTKDRTISLGSNYRLIAGRFEVFKLVALRTDLRPFHLLVLDLPKDPPARIALDQVMIRDTPMDGAFGSIVAAQLSSLIVASGTLWTKARSRDDGYKSLEAVAARLKEDV